MPVVLSRNCCLLYIRSVDVTNEEYWLVLKNSAFSTSTYWDDGSSSAYRRWAPDEPDADLTTCVYFHTGGLFYDSYCTTVAYKYVCKMAAGKYVSFIYLKNKLLNKSIRNDTLLLIIRASASSGGVLINCKRLTFWPRSVVKRDTCL